ncbi:MAG: prepilin-type N-terminal cleavage/methylation domain-containing protein [Gemmatimonadaceae bacterium]
MIGRAGVTLLELILAIAILGLMAGIVGLSAPHFGVPSEPQRAVTSAMRLRDSAIRIGRRVTGSVRIKSRLLEVTAYPDGRVLADSELNIDAYSGRVPYAAR